MSEDKDAQRRTLAEKLNKEVEDFVKTRTPKPYTEGWSEDNWEKEMEEHPLFASGDVGEHAELPPLMEALQQLKYDPDVNSPEELANSYKEDGNNNFKLKKYRWAVDSYSAGLKLECTNQELNTVLLTNRAAAHIRLGNFRTALKDVESAKKLTPSHLKALVKGAQCCHQLAKFKECLGYCQEALKLDPENAVAQDYRAKAVLKMKEVERNKRKELAKENKQQKEDQELRQAFKLRNIRFHGKKNSDLDLNKSLTGLHPASGDFRVFLNPQGQLVWPVIFLYPEYGQTDFVEQFSEENKFIEHLEEMFNSSNRPGFDVEGKYQPGNISIHFEDVRSKELLEFSSCLTLKEILSHKRFFLLGGNPSFLLMVKPSPFYDSFKDKHKVAQL